MGADRYVRVVRRDTGQALVESALWCASRRCRMRGFMFRRRLAPGEALVLVHSAAGTASTSIHMFFVFCPLAAVWIDDQGRVTSAQLAKPWRPYYASSDPARYVLEANPKLLEQIEVGVQLDFEHLSAKPAI